MYSWLIKPIQKCCRVELNLHQNFAKLQMLCPGLLYPYMYTIYICYIQNHLALYIFNSDSVNYCSKMEVLSEKNATNPN